MLLKVQCGSSSLKGQERTWREQPGELGGARAGDRGGSFYGCGQKQDQENRVGALVGGSVGWTVVP